MNIIQQLKDNKCPFGLMSEEMQEKAREIECGAGDWFQRFSREWADTLHIGSFAHSIAYRLRSGYEKKPEITEHEILCNDSVGQFYFDGLNMCPLSQVFNRPDFIGFKFEDDSIRMTPIVYKRQDGHYDSCSHVHCITSSEDTDKVLHAQHVLIRRQE